MELYDAFLVYSKKQDRFARKFVLSQKFSDVSNIAEGESRFGSSEKRFNIPWLEDASTNYVLLRLFQAGRVETRIRIFGSSSSL